MLPSSEGGYVQKLIEQSSERWLRAAEQALTRNTSTFAMLPMTHITGELSLIDELERRGYTVRAPR